MQTLETSTTAEQKEVYVKRLLKIDSSARISTNNDGTHRSLSKQLGCEFVAQWMNKNHRSEVIHRDLALTPPEFITQDWIGAAFTAEEQRTTEQQQALALSNQLYDEMAQANIIVLTAPMYNYGMPAVLKAWFDQIMRVNQTFTFDLSRGDYPIRPILTGKTVVLICSCGEFGFGPGEERTAMNHLSPHVQLLSQYLGADHFHEIRSEYQEFSDHRHQLSLDNARRAIAALIEELPDH